jgi:hypothetical protein
MNHPVFDRLRKLLAAGLFTVSCGVYPSHAEDLLAWKQSGDFAILTTPEGANIAADASVHDFPLLVRLDRDWFDFSQAMHDGKDLRFTQQGKILPHQIEEWDPLVGTASIWVRVPLIKGNDRQMLTMHWSNAEATDVSDGKKVFNDTNGYLSVWHLGPQVADETGLLETKDQGTTPTAGVVGKARAFSVGSHLSCGNQITSYPSANASHTTEVWFRSAKSNVNLIGWGNQKQQGKVVMQFRGPPHVNLDCWFSDGNVKSKGLLTFNEWHHAVFAYESGNAKIYVDGELAGQAGRGTPLNIPNPAMLTIGGWSGENNFIGDLDEVRVSNLTRSADWIKLQYENQKPLQNVVGPLIRAEGRFAIPVKTVTVKEGEPIKLSVQADGAQKLYWYLRDEGPERLVAVDRYHYDFISSRVKGATTALLTVKAIYPNRVETGLINITIKKSIPDPQFTIIGPKNWDGRTPIELSPRIINLAALQKTGAAEVKIEWQVHPISTVKEILPGKLRLIGAQKSGTIQINVMVSNGGVVQKKHLSIPAVLPTSQPWLARKPEPNEKPEEGRFYARDDTNQGTLFYNGILTERVEEVFLNIYADEKPYAILKTKPGKDLGYAFTAKLKPGFIKYRVEFGTRSGGKETVLDQIGNLVCGDAFLIEGQSNAEALDLREERQKPRETNEWIRTFGGPKNGEDGVAWVKSYDEKTQQDSGKRPSLWCKAVWAQQPPEHNAHIGWWGMELAKRLIESQKVPICIINGALGGTRIDQHQRNPENPADLTTIYGKWLWRMQEARLTHGIRAILWHQGENDQPADTPTGDYGWVNYQSYFCEMAGGWYRDMPNARRYVIFQIWPNSCAMGGTEGNGDRLREQQRALPDLFDNISIMSTLGIKPPGGCHFPREGYDEFARLIHPVIERDVYGKKFEQSVTAPRMGGAMFEDNEIVLYFDQPVVWNDALLSQFYLDGEKDKFASGRTEGNKILLTLKPGAVGTTISYLKEAQWSQNNLLIGKNGIAALTFCEVPIIPTKEP